MSTTLTALMSVPMVALAPHATPIDELARLRSALGPACPRLLMKRDDLLSFGLGGNKVRKMQAVAAEAVAAGADTLITCGGVQSNHARVTAAAGAVLGLRVVLVLNVNLDGAPPEPPTANARLDRLFGADIEYVPSRDARAPRMLAIAGRLRGKGQKPFIVPLGASTATGALGFARGVAEIATAGARPDVIVHATSSGGTQAGLIAGCALLGLRTRILGISADDPAPALRTVVRGLVDEMAERLAARPASLSGGSEVDVDDRFVGGGYGVPTAASTEALELVARREGILLEPVYTAKAMAGLIAHVRDREFSSDQTILFWHTGGLPGYFT